MSILVIAEHDNANIKVATLNTVAAALKIGGDIDVLVAGHSSAGAAQAAATQVAASAEAATKAEAERVAAVNGVSEKSAVLLKANEALAAATNVVVKAMTELVEERFDLVVSHQRWLAGSRLREVCDKRGKRPLDRSV